MKTDSQRVEVASPLSAGVRGQVTIPVRRAGALFALALLTSCAHSPTVRVPVRTACVSGTIPAEPPKIGPSLTGDSGKDIGLIASSNILLRAWGRSLLGIVEACRK